ncbi:hypothetical protein HHK36_000018 [Tetracentron sinense]|uniref:Growth-regulating factor n=1 Tax=Tetracentron sinense TaxID=13715 RepID=A0A834ZUR6_TETSI|nr:hypothetical protein HHK36_000018 [Tetracentron sinense]
MENGTGTGFVVADKAEVESGGGSGLKLQRTQSFPYKMVMMMPHHLFSSSERGGGTSGDENGGPTFYNGSNEVGRCMTNIYDVAGAGAVARTLQPFNSIAVATSFKSPGGREREQLQGSEDVVLCIAGGMAASLRFPFTSAQWQELERQAMIYKYMMASVPIPPELLLSINRNLSDTTASHSSNLGRGSCFNLRFSNNTDPEPGRCRRTDGKKWRCSRDVAPDQKYCERHMHRGRPRSRKPVEVNNDNKTPLIPPSPSATSTLANLSTDTNTTSSYHLGASKPYHKASPLLDKSDYTASCDTLVSSETSYKEPRGLNWTMKGEMVHIDASNQQWQHLMQSKGGLRTDVHTRYDTNASAFQQHYEEPLNLNLYGDFGGGQVSDAQQQNDQSNLFLNSELASLEELHRQTPRRFIDAWSTAGRDETADTSNKSMSSVSSNGKLKLPSSSLTLSMSGGNGTSEDTNQIQMGLGNTDSDNGDGVKSQPLNWMTTPVPWIASPPGGPLAEVLRSSTATTTTTPGSNEASPHGHGCTSPRAHTESSPSGVLLKTIASLSDSSGCSETRGCSPMAEP